jgi:hypothetical protein
VGLDDILAGADAAAAEQQDRDDAQAWLEAELAADDARFVSSLLEWVSDAVRRLTQAGVPTVTAFQDLGAAGASTSHEDATGGRRRLWRRGTPSVSAIPEQARTAATPGWIVYPCILDPAAPEIYRNGQPFLAGFSVAWGQHWSYGESVGGFKAAPRLLLTTQKDALVVAEVHALKPLGRVERHYTLTVPSETTSTQPLLGLVGIQAQHLSRKQLLEVGGSLPLGAAQPTSMSLARQSFEAIQQALSNQLVNWELGVRRLLAQHANNLPLYLPSNLD